MFNGGVILVHDNTHTAVKTQELLQKFKWIVWSHQKHLSGTRFSSNSDMKTAAENWLNGQGRDFYQAMLSKLVLRLDKGLNRFGDYMESDRQ
ncbi:hypothetical protein AVEN_189983-1, partial [Araneus ventricosus]